MTTFELSLSSVLRVIAEFVEKTGAFFAPRRQTRSTALAKRPRILLIDDDPLFGKVMTTLATRRGLTLSYLSEVNRLAQSISHGYDVIILDYELENITGVQVLDILQRYIAGVPVILVSSYERIGAMVTHSLVRATVGKSEGPWKILEVALAEYKENTKHLALSALAKPGGGMI